MNQELASNLGAPSPARAATDSALATRHGASIDQGLFKHGEHFSDLILVQGATQDRRFFETFRSMTEDLMRGIAAGSMHINEKVDGLAALTLGLDSRNRPFLATKHGIDKKRGPQKLMTSLAAVDRAYAGNRDLRKTFRDCMRHLQPRIKEALQGEYKNLVVQGDIIFTPTLSKKEISADGIKFTPNAVQYSVAPTDPLFSQIDRAYVGVVIHTVYVRSVDPQTKRVEVAPHPDQNLVRVLAEKLSSPNAAVLHPWRDGVTFTPASDFTETQTKVCRSLEGIEDRLKLLSIDFIAAWNTVHLDKMRTYINTGLNPPKHGGLFKAVRAGEEFNFKMFVEGMSAWIEKRAAREPDAAKGKEESFTKYRDAFSKLVAQHPTELRAMLEAFYAAVRTQDLLVPHLEAPLASRLGGEPGEGIMLRSNGMVVKFIDRLGFTMRNNARWNRGALAEPFHTWVPGTHVLQMKLQPPHAGHIALIRKTVAAANGAPVIVLASRKEPNVRATTYKALKAADTKSELAAGKYTHTFSRALRTKMIAAADLAGATVCMLDTKILEQYLARANEERATGKIHLVVGEKELATSRYADLLETYGHLMDQVALPLEAGGISGTEVRELIRACATNSGTTALAKLNDALSYITSDKKRAAIIERMCVEFRKIDQAAKRITAPRVKARSKKRVSKSDSAFGRREDAAETIAVE